MSKIQKFDSVMLLTSVLIILNIFDYFYDNIILSIVSLVVALIVLGIMVKRFVSKKRQ